MNNENDQETTPLLDPESRHLQTSQSNLELFNEIQLLFHYAWPVSAGYLLQMSLSLVSIFFLGHVGTQYLAASALATMFANVTGFSLIIGMATALDTLCSQAHTGSSDPHALGKHLQRSWVISSLVSIPILIIWLNTEHILILCGQNSQLAALAQEFIWYMIPSLIPNFLAETTKRFLQAQGCLTNQCFVTISSCLVHFNPFIKWNPKFSLGFKGAPIAISLTYTLMALLYFLYAKYSGGAKAWGGFSLNHMFNLVELWEFIKLGVPGVAMVCSEWWAYEIVALAAGLLGEEKLAAQSSSLPNHARFISHSALFLALLLAILNASFLYLLRNQWGYIWSSDERVVKIISEVVPLVAFFQFSDAIGCIGGGIIRFAINFDFISGIGVQELGAVIYLVAYYVIGLPIGWFLTFNVEPSFGLQGMWIGLTIALVLVSLVQTIMLFRIDWNNAAEKAQIRIAVDSLNRPDDEESSTTNSGSRNS